MLRAAIAASVLLLAGCGDADLYLDEELDDLSNHGGADLSDDELAEFSQNLTTAPVLVNECKSGSAGYIELINMQDKVVDLFNDPGNCFFVDDKQGGAAPRLITDSNVRHATGSTTCSSVGRPSTCARIAPKERVWINVTFIDASSIDQCRLLHSAFTAGACSATTTDLGAGGYAYGAGSGYCYGRAPDGKDWVQGKLEACSPNGAPNPARTLCSGTTGWANTYCNDNNPCTVGEFWSDSCVCGSSQTVSCVAPDEVCKVGVCSPTSGCAVSNKADGTSCTTQLGAPGSCTAGGCFAVTQLPKLVINEFMGGTSGWVEIYNPSDVELPMDGWRVDDIEGGSAPKIIPTNNQIQPFGRMLVYFAGINVSSTDTVRLINPSGVVIDSHGNFFAGSSISGKCFGRMPNGGSWATTALSSCSPAGHNPVPKCAGGTFGGVTFTEAEACKTVEYLNKAPYSTLGGSSPSNTAYDCAPDGRCGARRSAWNTLAELESFGGGSCTGTAFSAWKSAATAWVDDGRRTDTVSWTFANRSALKGKFVALDKVYVSAARAVSAEKNCAEVRDSPTSSGFITVCEYVNPYCDCRGSINWASLVGKYLWVRGYVTWDPFLLGGRWTVQESRNGSATSSAACGSPDFYRLLP